MSAPSPLPAELELEDELIVLSVVDGWVDTTIAHLPTARRGTVDWNHFDYPPSWWGSACDQAEGWVYNRGGVLEHIEICGACEAAA